MDKNLAVQNQKVFVTLESVLDLQREYLRTESEIQRVRLSNAGDTLPYTQRKRQLEQVIDILGLPITKV
jgi:hypothetical protein